MDKQWQDIFYIDGSNCYSRNKNFEKVVLCIRQVHMLKIEFGNRTIDIIYRDIDGVLHDVILDKLPLHYLKID